MDESLDRNMLLIVTGATLRAEKADRPLAYKVQAEAQRRLTERVEQQPEVLVISDVWYLNCRDLHDLPAISIGGPGVNHVAAYWQSKLPSALVVENVFQIQMDVRGRDHRCSIWGMDHETTVEAVETFLSKGHLDRFLDRFGRTIA